MASVYSLLKSLQRTFEGTHDDCSVPSQCYQTLLSHKQQNDTAQTCFSHHLRSKLSDFAFIASKYGLASRAHKLHQFIDAMENGEIALQSHHLDVLAILLEIAESESNALSSSYASMPLSHESQRNNMECDLFGIGTDTHAQYAVDHSSSHITSIHALDSLFQAIPLQSQAVHTRTAVATRFIDDEDIFSGIEEQKDITEAILDSDLDDDDDDINFMHPFDSHCRHSGSTLLLTAVDTRSLNSSLVDSVSVELDNPMGVGTVSTVDAIEHHLQLHAPSSELSLVADECANAQFREEWNDTKLQWRSVLTAASSSPNKHRINPPHRPMSRGAEPALPIATDRSISCAYFNAVSTTTVIDDTAAADGDHDDDYLLSAHQLDMYHQKYMFSTFGDGNSTTSLQKTTVPACVSSADLVSSILHGLLGIASERLLMFDAKQNEFLALRCVCKGWTMQSLTDILSDVCDTATKHVRVEQWIEEMRVQALSDTNGSFIAQCLCVALAEYLAFYKQCILALPACIRQQYSSLLFSHDGDDDEALNVMDIMAHSAQLKRGLDFVYYLCEHLHRCICMHRGGGSGGGVHILQFLYDEVLRHIDNERSVCIFLFQACLEPLVEIICAWIYCGELNDVYAEIAAQTATQKHKQQVQFKHLPLFLQALRADIERCGYSLNILKKCDFDLFHCCYVPKFFDDEHSHNRKSHYYPVRAVFGTDDIQTHVRRQHQLIKLQMSFFKEIRHSWHQLQQRTKDNIQQAATSRAQVLKQKFEQQQTEIEAQRRVVTEKQQKMRHILLQDLTQRKTQKTRDKQQAMQQQRKRLFDMEQEAQLKTQRQAEEIRAEIARVETQRKRTALLMQWKIDRARLSGKRAEVIQKMDEKYFAEMQQIKDVEKLNAEMTEKLVISSSKANGNGDATHNIEIEETRSAISRTQQEPAAALTEAVLKQFETLQIEQEHVDVQDEDEDMKLAEIENVSHDPQQQRQQQDECQTTAMGGAAPMQVEQAADGRDGDDDGDVLDIALQADDDETTFARGTKYKAQQFETDFNFFAVEQTHAASDDDDDVEHGTAATIGMTQTRIDAMQFIFDWHESYIPVQECMKQSIINGIQLQSFMVDKVTLFLFMAKLKLLSHFESLYRFYLMNAGDLMCRFGAQLYRKQQEMHYDAFIASGHCSFLNLVFSSCTKYLHYESDEYVQRLQFVASPITDLERSMLAEMVGHSSSDSSSFLCDVFMHYRLEWPLTEIITPQNLKSYNFVFIFFLYLHHIQSEVVQCWTEMKAYDRQSARQRSYNESLLSVYAISWSKLQMFRRECQHIIGNLMAFFNNQILNVSWTKFKQNVMNIWHEKSGGETHIMTIKALHDAYLEHLLESCFLKSEQHMLRRRLHNMLELMMNFKNNTTQLLQLIAFDAPHDDNLNSVHNQNIHHAVRNIVHCMESFESVSHFVFKVIDKINQQRMSRHMHHLSLQLDFNGYYRSGRSDR